MKVYLDPQTLFNGGRPQQYAQPNDEAIRILKRALKEAKKAAEDAKKKPDNKKKDEDEDKFSALDYFLLMMSVGSALVGFEAYIILSNVIHLVEVLHK